MKKIYLIIVISLLIVCNIYSQTAYLVKDITPGVASSDISNMYSLNGAVYFFIGSGTNPIYLWKSDGTAAGTVQVKPIVPSGSPTVYPPILVRMSGLLYFAINDKLNGKELWKTDGTAAGTVMVKDINAGVASSNPSNLIVLNNILYFSADDGINGVEFWKSDGTAAGTVMVKDIDTSAGASGNPKYIVTLNNSLYFVANDGILGEELWKSDGTNAGTLLVKDIEAGINGSNISNLITVNNILFFGKAILPGYPIDDLWISDGTSIGTTLVYSGISGGMGLKFLQSLNGAIIMIAEIGGMGRELCKSDGTLAGTVLVKDIFAGPNSSFPIFTGPWSPAINGKMFFTADDGFVGEELWITDGTANGTNLVKDINGLSSSTSMYEMTDVQGILYFIADDGVNGWKLWKSDGTNTGTVIATNNSGINAYSGPGRLANMNGQLFFYATDATHGNELWALNTTVGINDVSKKNELNIFPNPASDMLYFKNLEIKNKTYLVIENMIGERIIEQELNKNEIDINGLPPSIYIIKIKNDSNIILGKFVKE